MTALDIQARIIRSTGLPDYPLPLVTKALSNLVRRHDVHRLPGTSGKALYRLSVSRFTAVDLALSQTDQQDHDFRDSVVRRLEQRHGRLNRDDREIVGTAFIEFVGRMLSALGERCAHRLIQERSGKRLSYPTIHDDLTAAIRGLPNQLQDDSRTAFEDALRHPSKEEADYLYSAGQVFYIAELLNIDPALQHLQRRRFEKTVLFLDTNILLALTHPNDEAHTAVTQMVALCNAAGFQLVFSPATAEEFESLITAAENEFRATPVFDVEAAASFAPAVRNPVLRGWLESYPEHRASWTQYRASIAAWRSRLEQIDVFIYSLPDRPRDKGFKALANALAGKRRSRAGESRDPKRPRAIEHDAQLVTSIENLVAEDPDPADPFGPRYWLITHDKHLVDCARAHGADPKLCVAMLADEWVQYISPFLSPDTSSLDPATAFAGLLSSRFMPSLGRRMSLSQLQVFAEPQVASLTAGLSQEDACRAISDAHLEAVTRGGSKEQTDERSVRRLAEIAAKKRAQLERKGDLVPASRLDVLRAEREREADRFAKTSNDQASQLEDLESRLRTAEADQKTSISFLGRMLQNQVLDLRKKLGSWMKRHPVRVVIYSILLIVIGSFFLLGIGTLLQKGIGTVLVFVTFLTADFDQVRKNLQRLWGR